MDTKTLAVIANEARWDMAAAGVLGDAIEDAGCERPWWAGQMPCSALAAIMRYVGDVAEGLRLYESWLWARDECRVEREDDHDAGRPWDNDCIYDGLVSGERDGCAPGEGWWPLTDRWGGHRYFDVRGATRQGVADGLSRADAGRRAVEMCERLRAWFRDEWHYCAVSVHHQPSGDSASLCGLESDDADYLAYTEAVLADELRGRVGRVVAWEFRLGGDALVYAPGMSDEEYHERYPGVKRIGDGIDMDGVTTESGDDVYLCWVDDCFDPPLCVVRAYGVSDAEEAFFDQYDWADMSAEDLADYPADYGVPTARGTVASTENVRVAQLRLEAVIWGGA